MSDIKYIWETVKRVYFAFALSVLAFVLFAGLILGHVSEDGWPWLVMIVTMVVYERMHSA